MMLELEKCDLEMI